MPDLRYRLVTGNFYARFDERPLNYQPEPDGDTIRFVPDNPYDLADTGKFRRFGFRGPKVSEFGINIRFEAIDALETHFKNSHQNLELANAARDLTLELLGFTNVKFSEDKPNKIASVDNNPSRGFVLANGIDGNGRLLGFVYAGGTENVDPELKKREEQGKPRGSSGPVDLGLPTPLQYFLGPDVLKKSINWKLIEAGLAYGEFYTTLPLDLMRVIADKIRELRTATTPGTIWDEESVNTSRTIIWDKKISSLEDRVLYPKIYRRLISYAEDNDKKAQMFRKWIRNLKYELDRNDRLLLPPAKDYISPPFCEFGNLHDVIDIINETEESLEFRLFQDPEDLIVLPDNV